MKSRELKTTPAIVVNNYTICHIGSGKYLHRFTPAYSHTVYQCIDGKSPLFDVGQLYNIGYSIINGEKCIDPSTIAKADTVIPTDSHDVARMLGELKRAEETQKSNQRVTYSATDGPYLGKKYAWRIFGMAIAKDTFYLYLDTIGHPSAPCITRGSPSVAYKEEGLEEAMDKLIKSCTKIKGNRFSSPLLPDRKYFTVKGIRAITDKK